MIINSELDNVLNDLESDPTADRLKISLGLEIGYDFDRTTRGITLEIGAGYLYLRGMNFTGSTMEITVSSLNLYGKLLIK